MVITPDSTTSRKNSAQLLALCRERFTETLVAAARNAGVRLDTLLEVVARHAEATFDELAGLHSKADYERLRSATASRITLVHHDDMDLTVQLINLSQSLTDSCERELPRLHLLFMSLLGQESSVLGQLPVGPGAVTQALRSVCDSDVMPSELRLSIPDRLGATLPAELTALYRELTQALEEQGIEPKSLLRPKDNTPQHFYHRPRPERAQDSLSETVERAVAPSMEKAAAPAEGESLDNALRRLQSVNLRRHMNAGGTAQTPIDPSLLEAITERVIGWLTERQRRAAAVGADRPQPRVNLADLSALLPAASNVALETVNACFDSLAHDAKLSPSIKSSLDRLRLPLSKVVLIDHAFLGDAGHPARRFLALALRLAWSISPQAIAADSPEHEVCAVLEAAARRIQMEFERDLAPFTRESDALDAFLLARDANQAEYASRLAPVLMAEAKREHARSAAAKAVRALCASEPPEPVRDFLEQLWVRVLAAVHQRHGEKSQHWIAALSTGNRLVSSVQPKLDAQDRQELTSTLPALLEDVRRWLDAIGTPETMRESALQSFVSCHAAALRGKVFEPETRQTAQKKTPRVITSADLPGLQLMRMPPESMPEHTVPDWLKQLNAGDLLQLRLGTEVVRLVASRIEGSPRLVLLTRPRDTLAIICPLRWLALGDQGPHTRAVPQDDLFERLAEAALRQTTA